MVKFYHKDPQRHHKETQSKIVVFQDQQFHPVCQYDERRFPTNIKQILPTSEFQNAGDTFSVTKDNLFKFLQFVVKSKHCDSEKLFK